VLAGVSAGDEIIAVAGFEEVGMSAEMAIFKGVV